MMGLEQRLDAKPRKRTSYQREYKRKWREALRDNGFFLDSGRRLVPANNRMTNMTIKKEVPLILALRAELHDLESHFRNDPRYRRMKMICDLLREYEGKGANSYKPEAGPTIVVSKKVTIAEVKQATIEFLRTKGLAHRKTILKHLIDKRLMGTQKYPLQTLAVYFSIWKDTFVSDGIGNFSMRPQLERANG